MTEYYIDMIDVGEGDAFVIAVPDPGVVCLVDAGSKATAPNIVSHLHDHYGQIDHLILTHVDDDHIRGVETLIDEGLIPKSLWVNDPRDYKSDSRTGLLTKESRRITASVGTNSNVIDQLGMEGVSRNDLFAGTTIPLASGVRLRVLSPTLSAFKAAIPHFSASNRRQLSEKTAARRSCSAENSVSVVLALEVYSSGGKLKEEALFTADACLDVLKRVASKAYHWVKIPHHGSWNNCDEELVDKWCSGAGVTAAALSCGKEGRYDHPDDSVLAWFTDRGARVCCTACSGTVSFRRLGAPSHEGFSPIKRPCRHLQSG